MALRRRMETRGGDAQRAMQAALYEQRLAEQDAAHPGYRAAWRSFSARLLLHGGWNVVPPVKPDVLINMLAGEGRTWPGVAAGIAGDPNECHRNVVGLWRKGTVVAIGTGYALSSDGLWREHSWGFGSHDEVIETTISREAYFGIRLDGPRAAWFADWIEPETTPSSTEPGGSG